MIRTAPLMLTTLLVLLPGTLAMTWFFGIGILINVIVASLLAAAVEAIALKLRGRHPLEVRDGSALLTGALIALCLSPVLPLWMLCLGVVLGVLLGKQVYGGTGQNVFNPAMVGYAILILSFPLAMNTWPSSEATPMVTDTLVAKISMTASGGYDGLSGATPLDSYRFREGLTNAEYFEGSPLGNWQSWAWINLGFLAGGAYLLYRKLIPWQTPVAFLGTLTLLSMFFYDGGSSMSLGSPLFHLFSGATMMAAFFIVTDPVTCPSYPEGLLVFGVGVGLITFIIRSIGAYPEGVAFGVLLMNASSPLIDHVISRYRAS